MVRHLIPDPEPIPSFWSASIKLGKTTELEYYKHILPRHLKKEFMKKIENVIENCQCSSDYWGALDKLKNKLKKEYQNTVKMTDDEIFSKKEDSEALKEIMFGVFNKETHILVKHEDITDWLNLHIEQAEQKVISEFLEDLKKTCNQCPNRPFNSSQCTIWLKGCPIYPLRNKWEE